MPKVYNFKIGHVTVRQKAEVANPVPSPNSVVSLLEVHADRVIQPTLDCSSVGLNVIKGTGGKNTASSPYELRIAVTAFRPVLVR